ncbi:GNAT family N-acetyltransferase [Arthrobacter sp. KK5.5]|uniref:GNAT family N-acetyltransferase n=1 Tax=Arthrobacter sp. KK5.5 TaxID=3373084 RepID=UPI003EE7FA1B
MAGILRAQAAFSAWQEAVAAATGGRVFTTHGCTWAWQPAHARLHLLFPPAPGSAGLRPGLAEGTRLGALEVSVWLNAAADASALGQLGFTDAPPVLWHAGRPHADGGSFRGGVLLGGELPEAKGAEAEGMHVVGSTPAGTVQHAAARTVDGELVGRGFGMRHRNGDVSLHGLAVGAEHRRRGAGRALAAALAAALLVADDAEDRSSAVLAGTGPAGSEFLRACGLQLVGRGRHLRLRNPTP